MKSVRISQFLKKKNKMDPIRVQSECQVRDQLRGRDQLRVERVESAIALYFSCPTKWAGSTTVPVYIYIYTIYISLRSARQNDFMAAIIGL